MVTLVTVKVYFFMGALNMTFQFGFCSEYFITMTTFGFISHFWIFCIDIDIEKKITLAYFDPFGI